jgi:hypothetical protein
MPLWLWLIVLGGLTYGLAEVGLRERRAARRRVRLMRADAHRRAFGFRADEQHHQITALLVLIPDLGTPRNVGPVFDGQLLDGTPLTVFDFHEVVSRDHTVGRIGFVLDYPTDWPTFELASTTSRSPREHELSRALLASPLCDYLAAQRDWLFAFSGGSLIGITHRLDGRDFERVRRVATGVDDHMPVELVLRWAA